MYYGRFEKGHILPTERNIDKFANLMGMSIEEVQKSIDMKRERHLEYLAELDKQRKSN